MSSMSRPPRQEPQDQMAVIAVLAWHLARLRGPARLPGADGLFHPTAPAPRPDHARGRAGGHVAEEVRPLAPRMGDADHRRPARGGAGAGQPGLADPGQRRAVVPGPVGPAPPLPPRTSRPSGRGKTDERLPSTTRVHWWQVETGVSTPASPTPRSAMPTGGGPRRP